MLVTDFVLDDRNPLVRLTTYILDDSLELLDGKKRPAVLICPGGAYLNCSDREEEAVALRFAAMGYHAFVLRYHVYLRPDERIDVIFTKDKLSKRPETVYPAPIQDIAQAMRILHDHADEWLLDSDRIALCGFSAGGHNVTNYAVHWDKPVLTDDFDVSKLRPAAVIAGYPLTDYVFMKEAVSQQNPMDQRLFQVSNLSLLGAEEPSDELLMEVSPSRLVDQATPPMFIWATANDSLVPVVHSTRLAASLAEAGIPFECHIFEEGPHGLSLAMQATAKAKTEVNEIASQWVDLAEKWLGKRFALPLDEKTRWT